MALSGDGALKQTEFPLMSVANTSIKRLLRVTCTLRVWWSFVDRGDKQTAYLSPEIAAIGCPLISRKLRGQVPGQEFVNTVHRMVGDALQDMY
jgi:hypothetical protein